MAAGPSAFVVRDGPPSAGPITQPTHLRVRADACGIETRLLQDRAVSQP